MPKPVVELDSAHLDDVSELAEPELTVRLTPEPPSVPEVPEVPTATVMRLRVRRSRAPFMPRPFLAALVDVAEHPLTMIACAVLACSMAALAIAAAAGRLPPN